MIEKMKYTNHMNEVVEFGVNRIFANYNDLRDYEWKHTASNNKITAFSRGIVSKTLPLIICCTSEEEGLAIKNRLFEVTDKDVLALQHGRITIGDYYLKCFVTASKKGNYLKSKGYLEVTLEISTDYPFWTKETKYEFLPKNRRPDEIAGSLDFENDFAYDYTSELFNMHITNPGFVGSNFKLIIYGGCIDPEINIGGHKYQVYCEMSEKEYVTIDSAKKSITYTRYNGEEINVFNERNKESYVFEKIPSGDNMVSWNNDFGFDIILYEERSEPKWT